MTSSPRTSTHPTGTSPRWAAPRASSSAISIKDVIGIRHPLPPASQIRRLAGHCKLVPSIHVFIHVSYAGKDEHERAAEPTQNQSAHRESHCACGSCLAAGSPSLDCRPPPSPSPPTPPP